MKIQPLFLWIIDVDIDVAIMLLKKLKKKIFERRFFSITVPKVQLVPSFDSWNRCAFLLSLSKENNIQQELEQIRVFCTRFSKEIVVICYVKYKLPETINLSPDVILITPDKLNFLGFLKKQALQILENEKFDVLIDLSIKSNFVLNQLAASIQAHCKITGSVDPDMRVFDVHIVRNEKNHYEFLKQVKNIFQCFIAD